MQSGRRLFFQTLLGLPAVAAAAPPKPAPVVGTIQTPQCECTWQFIWGCFDGNEWNRQYMFCANPKCQHYKRPLAIPTIAIHDLDPALAARVQKEEEARERNHRLNVDGLQKTIKEWERENIPRPLALAEWPDPPPLRD